MRVQLSPQALLARRGARHFGAVELTAVVSEVPFSPVPTHIIQHGLGLFLNIKRLLHSLQKPSLVSRYLEETVLGLTANPRAFYTTRCSAGNELTSRIIL